MSSLLNGFLYIFQESVERIMNDSWSGDCLSYIPQFQEVLAQSTDIKLNLYTCALKNLDVLGHSSYPWSHDEDSVYHGVVIHPGTLPGGTITPINEGDNLVHEVGGCCSKLQKYSCHDDSFKNTVATTLPRTFFLQVKRSGFKVDFTKLFHKCGELFSKLRCKVRDINHVFDLCLI